MNAPFEERLNQELKAAATRLQSGTRRPARVARLAVAMAVIVVTAVGAVLFIGGRRHVELPATRSPDGDATTADVEQRDALRAAVHLPVEHVTSIAAPQGTPHLPDRPAARWLIGRTAKRICFAAEFVASCGDRSGFAYHGLVSIGPEQPASFDVQGHPAADAGKGPLNSMTGLLPLGFTEVRALSATGETIARTAVRGQAFHLTAPDVSEAVSVEAVRNDGTTLSLPSLGPDAQPFGEPGRKAAIERAAAQLGPEAKLVRLPASSRPTVDDDVAKYGLDLDRAFEIAVPPGPELTPATVLPEGAYDHWYLIVGDTGFCYIVSGGGGCTAGTDVFDGETVKLFTASTLSGEEGKAQLVGIVPNDYVSIKVIGAAGTVAEAPIQHNSYRLILPSSYSDGGDQSSLRLVLKRPDGTTETVSACPGCDGGVPPSHGG